MGHQANKGVKANPNQEEARSLILCAYRQDTGMSWNPVFNIHAVLRIESEIITRLSATLPECVLLSTYFFTLKKHVLRGHARLLVSVSEHVSPWLQCASRHLGGSPG